MKKLIILALFSISANAAHIECQTFVKHDKESRTLISYATVGTKSGVAVTDYGTDPFNPVDPTHAFFEMSKEEIASKSCQDVVLKNDRVMVELDNVNFRSFANCVGAK